MKKVGSFIKKNKKRIITLAIIIMVLFLIVLVFRWCLRIGIITPPKSVVLWYFNKNREAFDYIAEYVEENPEDTIDILYMEDEKIMEIEDERLRNSVQKLFKDGGYERIDYYPLNNERDRQITFRLSNLFVRKGEGFGIIYSKEILYSEDVYVGHDIEHRYEYEHIDGNWYYEYRVR